MDKGSRQNRSVTLGKGLALKTGAVAVVDPRFNGFDCLVAFCSTVLRLSGGGSCTITLGKEFLFGVALNTLHCRPATLLYPFGCKGVVGLKMSCEKHFFKCFLQAINITVTSELFRTRGIRLFN